MAHPVRTLALAIAAAVILTGVPLGAVAASPLILGYSTVAVGQDPRDVVISPDGSTAYVSNYGDDDAGTVSVVDIAAGSTTATIPVGERPAGLAVSPDGALLYVAENSFAHPAVSVIATESRSVVATVPLPGTGSLLNVAFSPDGLKAYVVHGFDTTSGSLDIIDVTTSTYERQIPLTGYGSPYDIVVSHDGATAYVSLGDRGVFGVDIASGTITGVPSGIARGLALSPDGTKIYAASNMIYETDLGTGATRVLGDGLYLGQRPFSLTVSPDGATLYVVDAQDPVLAVVDVVSGHTIRKTVVHSALSVAVTPDGTRVLVPSQNGTSLAIVSESDPEPSPSPLEHASRIAAQNAGAVAVNSLTSRLYVVNRPAHELAVIDETTRQAVAQIPLGTQAADVTVNETTNTVYVSDMQSNTVTIIDGVSNTVTATVPVGSGPANIAVDEERNRVFVSNANGKSVSVVDGATRTVVSTITVQVQPEGIVVDPATDRVFVVNTSSGFLSVIDATTLTTIRTESIGQGYWSIAVDSALGRLYIGNITGGFVDVADAGSGVVLSRIPSDASPIDMIVDPASHLVYLANAPGSVSVVDGPAEVLISTIPIAAGASGIAIDATLRTAYVAATSGIEVLGVAAGPTMTTSTLPRAYVGSQYVETVSAEGAPRPSFTIASGALPQGLALDSGTGGIVGTPTQIGSYSFAISATSRIDTDTVEYSIVVGAAIEPPRLIDDVLQTAQVGEAYDFALPVTGNPVPTFSLESGALPDGLSLVAESGHIVGVPTTVGTSVFSFNATNVGGSMMDAGLTLTVDGGRFASAPTPVVVGPVQVDSPLTADTGTWSPTPSSFSYQWLVDGTPVAGATGREYSPPLAYVGRALSVTVTASLANYISESRTSDPTSAVRPGAVQGRSPSVTGSRSVGQTLVAQTGTWTPASTVLTFQWFRGSEVIPHATGSQYELGVEDLGRVVTVRVTGTAAGYAPLTRMGRQFFATSIGQFTAPSGLALSDSPMVGTPLQLLDEQFTPSPTSTVYQWSVGGTPVPGATRSSYTPVPTDVGMKVEARVTVSRAGIETTEATVATAGAVAPGTLYSLGPPLIKGTGRVGAALTTSIGTWSPIPATSQVQWYRDGAPIAGAVSSTYTPVAGDVGSSVSVVVTAIRPGYSSATGASSAVTVLPGVVTVVAPPTISGSPVVGSTLVASAGSWSPAATNVTYQWYLSGSPVPGATGSTFGIAPTYVDSTVSVMVTAHRAGYDDGTSTRTFSSSVTGRVYATCAALNVDYPHGVMRPGAMDLRSGTYHAPYAGTFISQSVYNLNAAGRDADKDGIACEKQ
ncbi:MAG: hypothetical protein JWR04_3042 [Rhodoglobus sp.]|nr:hypothetical protein [Rhodoglobus sp.]